jgi:hypothetical protein
MFSGQAEQWALKEEPKMGAMSEVVGYPYE